MLNWRRFATALCTLYAFLLVRTAADTPDPSYQYVHAHISSCAKIFQQLDIDFNQSLPVMLADLIEQPSHWLSTHPGVVRAFDEIHDTYTLATSYYELPHSYILHEMLGNAEAVLEPLRYYRTHFRYLDRMALESLAHLSYIKVQQDNDTLANATFTIHPNIQWNELQFAGVVPSPFYMVYMSMACWLITIHAFLRLRFQWILCATSR
ncbi:glycoprotein 2 [Wobbly possum disease virus]|uniref:Glycoprotein 2 n=1 Tax=Wobbly possum disease virus TaxID=1118369 RepID=G9FGR8_9NIDO|nr:glycoprotein 2 [Wobbly possum disease virus]AEU12348.1 glycoprotein 2 [Wobbly possum disease virus]